MGGRHRFGGRRPFAFSGAGGPVGRRQRPGRGIAVRMAHSGAHRLGISEATVKKHVGHLLQRLGLHDRLQLGLFVARHPLVFETH